MEHQISDRTRELYAEALVWDMVWPWEPWCGNDFDTMARFHKAGFNIVSATIAGDNHNISEAVQRIAKARTVLQGIKDVRLCESVADIRAAVAAGNMAVLLHFEGSRPFERNLDMVETYYKLGIRQTILAFNNTNSTGGGAMEDDDGGLTHYGKTLIRELERVGMLLDLSHTGHKTTMDAMALASKPCVYTHSNVNAVFPHLRNISDEEIKTCAQTGGLLGIPSSSMYHGDPNCRPETLFKHLDYIVQLVGSEHAGLGLDYVFDAGPLNDWMRSRPDEWPDAKDPNWPGIKTAMPEDVLTLTDLMLGAGYSDQDVRNILGENYIRICSEVWT